MVPTTEEKREMFAFDLTADWKEAFKEKVLPNYKDEKTMASLARRIFQEIVACFTTETELRERGLLPPHRSMGKPDTLLFAIRRSEELRREAHVHEVPDRASVHHKKARGG